MLRRIKGFSNYAVDENGVVYSYYSNKNLKPGDNGNGYLVLSLKHDSGKLVTKYVHRLVAETYLPNPSNLPVVRHKDNITSNNTKDNLCWGTYKDNEDDKIDHGTYDLRRNGKLSKEDREKITNMYNVSRPTITRLINGTTWSNFKCAA